MRIALLSACYFCCAFVVLNALAAVMRHDTAPLLTGGVWLVLALLFYRSYRVFGGK